MKGDGGGIVVHDRVCGTCSNNLLEQSMRAGIGVMDLAQPIFIHNTIIGNEGGGTVMTGKSTPVFIDNNFSGNAPAL